MAKGHYSKKFRDNKGRRLAAIKNKTKIKPELGSKQKTQTLALKDTTEIKSEPSRYAEEDGKADPALRRFIPTQYQIHLPGQWLIQSVKMANLVAENLRHCPCLGVAFQLKKVAPSSPFSSPVSTPVSAIALLQLATYAFVYVFDLLTCPEILTNPVRFYNFSAPLR